MDNTVSNTVVGMIVQAPNARCILGLSRPSSERPKARAESTAKTSANMVIHTSVNTVVNTSRF